MAAWLGISLGLGEEEARLRELRRRGTGGSRGHRLRGGLGTGVSRSWTEGEVLGAGSSSEGSLKLGHGVFGEARKLEKELLG